MLANRLDLMAAAHSGQSWLLIGGHTCIDEVRPGSIRGDPGGSAEHAILVPPLAGTECIGQPLPPAAGGMSHQEQDTARGALP